MFSNEGEVALNCDGAINEGGNKLAGGRVFDV